jgi:hypothetical protein
MLPFWEYHLLREARGFAEPWPDLPGHRSFTMGSGWQLGVGLTWAARVRPMAGWEMGNDTPHVMGDSVILSHSARLRPRSNEGSG